MSMLPFSSIGNLVQAGIVAEAAASQVATSFSDLMEMFTQSIKKKMKTGEEDEDGGKTKTAELNLALLATQGVRAMSHQAAPHRSSPQLAGT